MPVEAVPFLIIGFVGIFVLVPLGLVIVKLFR